MTLAQKSAKNENQLTLPTILETAGTAASLAAAKHRFAEYRSRLAAQTIRRQDADLALFAEFLYTVKVREIGDLTSDPEAWRGVTWGLVETFVKWQLKEGYAVTSVNVRLSTLKSYARVALQAGTLSPEEYALIRSVQGYSQREKRRIDARRPQARVGLKKETPVTLSPEQAAALKNQPLEMLQGARDGLLMALLLDHGLRAGEVAGLTIENLDLRAGTLRFYRPKVGKTQTHRLSADVRRAGLSYTKFMSAESPKSALLRSVKKGGERPGIAALTTRGITLRVAELGKALGIENLSAHDLRHTWATQAARAGTDPFRLQQAGGWSSLAMPRRYVEDSEIANEGMEGK
ncbi:MAG TPA: tyrosine-type recombinase/integrase [Bellilinea sp.]|nr:tyrosine-type recombinase/integrase [Bellilinea sp.]